MALPARAARGLERRRARARRQLAQRWPSTSRASSGTTAVNVCYLVAHATLRLHDRRGRRPRRDAGRAGRDARAACARRSPRAPSGLSAGPHLRARDVRERRRARRAVHRAARTARSTARTTATTARTRSRATPTRSRSPAAPACRCTSPTAHLGFACNRGRAAELLEMIDAARADGVDITLDTYPYLAGATYLHALLPGWAHGGRPRGDDRAAARSRPARAAAASSWRTRHRRLPRRAGRLGQARASPTASSIADRAERAGRRPIDVYCELCADSGLSASALVHVGNEENVRAIMQHPAHTAGSDGILVGDRPHPRGWGTFAALPRRLRARARACCAWRSAIRQMTSLPAQRLGCPTAAWCGRGWRPISPSSTPRRVRDAATYEEPRLARRGLPARGRERRAGARRRRAHRRHAGPRAAPQRRA